MAIDLQLIPTIPFPAAPPTRPDSLTATCIADANLHRANLLNQRLHHDNQARIKYGNRAFYTAIGWLFTILVILILQGFCGHGGDEQSFNVWGIIYTIKTNPKFYLSDSVLIALIGGTTASVIGLLAFVMKSLFPTRGGKGDRSN